MNHRLIQNRHGQGLVEYIIIIVASVGLISLVSLSMFGHKVADQHAIGFGMLPGTCEDDNVAIATGFFAGVDEGASINSNGEVSWGDITRNTELGEMDNNVVTGGSSDAGNFVAKEEQEGEA